MSPVDLCEPPRRSGPHRTSYIPRTNLRHPAHVPARYRTTQFTPTKPLLVSRDTHRGFAPCAKTRSRPDIRDDHVSRGRAAFISCTSFTSLPPAYVCTYVAWTVRAGGTRVHQYPCVFANSENLCVAVRRSAIPIFLAVRIGPGRFSPQHSAHVRARQRLCLCSLRSAVAGTAGSSLSSGAGDCDWDLDCGSGVVEARFVSWSGSGVMSSLCSRWGVGADRSRCCTTLDTLFGLGI